MPKVLGVMCIFFCGLSALGVGVWRLGVWASGRVVVGENVDAVVECKLCVIVFFFSRIFDENLCSASQQNFHQMPTIIDLDLLNGV